MLIYTFTLLTDGQADTRAFRTEEARDAAVEKEVVNRYANAQDVGPHARDDLPNLNVALDEPATFISELTYGETELHTDEIVLEG